MRESIAGGPPLKAVAGRPSRAGRSVVGALGPFLPAPEIGRDVERARFAARRCHVRGRCRVKIGRAMEVFGLPQGGRALARLSTRLGLGVGLLWLLPLGAVIFTLSRQHYRRTLASSQRAAALETRVLENALRHQMVDGDKTLLPAILDDIASQPEVRRAMILDHLGRVRVSSDHELLDKVIPQDSPACFVCHAKSPEDRERWTFLEEEGGERNVLRSVLPIQNRSECHACHSPEKLSSAPWANGPNTKTEVDKFINNPDYPGKYGGYPRWIEDDALDAIVVSREPDKEKLNPDLVDNYLVCTISCLTTYPPSVMVNLNLGAQHLRSLERIHRPELIMIRAILNPLAEYELGSISYQIGENHINQAKLKKLLGSLQAQMHKVEPRVADLSQPTRHLRKQILILFPEEDLASLSVHRLQKILGELMERNMLPADVYQYIVDDEIMSLLDQISKKIFEDWWRPPIALPYVMAALEEELGLSEVEAQGRFNSGKLEWFRIYGFKGAEEKEKIESWRVANGIRL